MLDRLVAPEDLDLDGGVVLVCLIVNLEIVDLEVNANRLTGGETLVEFRPDLHRADHEHTQTDILGSHRGNLVRQNQCAGLQLVIIKGRHGKAGVYDADVVAGRIFEHDV